MESLANGVLPVASNFSGFAEGLDNLIPDLGQEKVDLMRLPMDDSMRVQGIADGIASLLGDPNDWSADLRKIATGRYDWAIRAKEMVCGYERFSK